MANLPVDFFHPSRAPEKIYWQNCQIRFNVVRAEATKASLADSKDLLVDKVNNGPTDP
jgi:hypothetical protein